MPTSDQRLIARAKEVLKLESASVLAQIKYLQKGFVDAIHLIAKSSGRTVIIGVGKSGLIGRKIAATLSSTGTPSVFVHPSEGLHGDLGLNS